MAGPKPIDPRPSIVMPIPPDAPPPPRQHPQLGRPDWAFRYSDAKDTTLHWVLSFNANSAMSFMPLTLWRDGDGRRSWAWKPVPENRPLKGLCQLAKYPRNPVLAVGGNEWTAGSAEVLCPDMVIVTSSGGLAEAQYTDWSPLRGRTVWVWGPNDEAGRRYEQTVATILSSIGVEDLQIVDASNLSAETPLGDKREPIGGWNAEDAIREGWTNTRFMHALREFATAWVPSQPTHR